MSFRSSDQSSSFRFVAFSQGSLDWNVLPSYMTVEEMEQSNIDNEITNEREGLTALGGSSPKENVSDDRFKHSLPFYFASTATFIFVYSVCHLNDMRTSLSFLGGL